MFVIFLLSLVVVHHPAFAANGVEDLLTDFSSYISTRVIPAVSGIGMGIGGIMAALGSPKGIEVVKYSLFGGVIGTAGEETIRSLFF